MTILETFSTCWKSQCLHRDGEVPLYMPKEGAEWDLGQNFNSGVISQQSQERKLGFHSFVTCLPNLSFSGFSV